MKRSPVAPNVAPRGPEGYGRDGATPGMRPRPAPKGISKLTLYEPYKRGYS